MDIQKFMIETKNDVDQLLDRLLPAASEVPETIHKAMRHSVFAGGKRVRPVMVLAAGRV